MERLLEMLAVLAFLYAGYALGIKRWNYSSQADRERRRTVLKTKGLSNTFYFIHSTTLFMLIVLSGGTFTFYWIYQQWKAVLKGFKRLDGTPLRYGPFLRTLASPITFFTLGSIINHTCEYMRKSVAWASAWWGTLWLGGLVSIFLPVGIGVRVLGALIFCWVPTVYQRHLNTLPNKHLPFRPKPKEVIAAVFGLILLIGLLLVLHLAKQ